LIDAVVALDAAFGLRGVGGMSRMPSFAHAKPKAVRGSSPASCSSRVGCLSVMKTVLRSV
jgi:hypothetical protein